jgi:hypothetical protein
VVAWSCSVQSCQAKLCERTKRGCLWMASAVVNEMASAEWGNPFEWQMQARVMSPAVDGAREGFICAPANMQLWRCWRLKRVAKQRRRRMAGQWQGARQGSGQADGNVSVDGGDGARMCTASQRICSDTDGKI